MGAKGGAGHSGSSRAVKEAMKQTGWRGGTVFVGGGGVSTSL